MKSYMSYLSVAAILLLSFNAIACNSKIGEEKKAIVFIAGVDEDNNTYYSNARSYFQNGNYQVVDEFYVLSDILNWIRLHYDKQIYDDIHIVSHSNPWFGLSLKTTEYGERITEASLKFALANRMIIPLEHQFLAEDSKIVFHACGLGNNKDLLKLLKRAFTEDEFISVYASEQFNVFGGKYSGHYLAKTYYGYYPTAQSPGPRQLAHEFKLKYPEVKTSWEQVLKVRTEQLPGAMYTYKFNIPVEWEFVFEDKEDIPEFTSKNEIMTWIENIDDLKNALNQLRIPIEKFRWLSNTKGNSLIIKGKTTVLCVIQPLMSASDGLQYLPVNLEGEHYVKL